MTSKNQIYNLFLREDFSAKEMVSYLYREISIEHETNRSRAVLESLELIVDQLKIEVHNSKCHLIHTIEIQLRSLTNNLHEVMRFLEKIINRSISKFKNGIDYKLKKLQQMSHEIAVLGLYLEV